MWMALTVMAFPLRVCSLSTIVPWLSGKVIVALFEPLKAVVTGTPLTVRPVISDCPVAPPVHGMDAWASTVSAAMTTLPTVNTNSSMVPMLKVPVEQPVVRAIAAAPGTIGDVKL
jgi:hypothetical protein